MIDGKRVHRPASNRASGCSIGGDVTSSEGKLQLHGTIRIDIYHSSHSLSND
jgi:hypothetical protein